MIELSFSKLENILDLENQKLANFPGVYIWGFKGLITSHMDTFIPYYVGITAEKTINKTILGRHKKDILTPKSTYQRLTYEYMHEFFKDNPVGFPKYPLTKKDNKKHPLNWSNWVDPADYNKCFKYYNNKYFISGKIKETEQLADLKNYPIGLIADVYDTQDDYLASQLRQSLPNFWILYAFIDKTSNEYLNVKKHVPFTSKKGIKKTHDQKVFELLEAYIKFSLRGITIAKHEGNLGDWNKYGLHVKINSSYDIFKDDPSDIFPGNYQ